MPSRSSILTYFIIALTSTSIVDGFTTIPHSTTVSSRRHCNHDVFSSADSRCTSFSKIVPTMKSSEIDDWHDNNNNNSNEQQDDSNSPGSKLDRISESRRRRMQIEHKAKSRFVVGDELHVLRKQVLKLREELSIERRVSPTSTRVRELERAIINAQSMDAEYVYSVSLDRIKEAELVGEPTEELRQEVEMARSVLPQYNLDGLWVGKYGEHGYEMINVTYSGDTLIAYKVTGDKNVPKGQISFQVDLNPNAKYATNNNNMVLGKHKDDQAVLQPIELTDDATEQWGTRHLERFAGMGQVAAEGFTNNQWVDGQLILVGEYFSFAWVPLGHQVFFGRPSAELTLKMLKKSMSKEEQTRHHLMQCMEETVHLQEDNEIAHPDSGLFIGQQQHQDNEQQQQYQDDFYCDGGCFE